MAKQKPSLIAFNVGEMGAEALARIDLESYDRGAETMENIIPLVQGGMSKCPGTVHTNIAAASAADTLTIMHPFIFSEEQAFGLEVSAGKMRFHFLDQGVVTLAGADATAGAWTDESGAGSAGGGAPPIIPPFDFDDFNWYGGFGEGGIGRFSF